MRFQKVHQVPAPQPLADQKRIKALKRTLLHHRRAPALHPRLAKAYVDALVEAV